MPNGVTITVNAETAEALGKLQEFFTKGSEGFSEVVKAGDFLKEMGAQIAAAFSVGAIVEFTKEAIDAAEGLKILSQQTGLTIETLSGLKEVADKTRDGFGGASLALTHFSQALGVALRQGGQSAQAFRDLIGIEGLRGVASGATSMDETLVEAAQKLNDLPNAMQRAEIALQLFGRSWRDIVPAISSVKGELEKGAITKQMAEDASEFNKSLRELRQEVEKLFIALASDLLPALKELVNFFKQFKDELGLVAAVVKEVGFEVKVGVFALETFALAGVEMAKTLIDGFQTAKKVFEDLVASTVKGAQVIAKATSGNILGAIGAFAEFSRGSGAGTDVADFLKRSQARGADTDAQAKAIFQRLFGGASPSPGSTGAAAGGEFIGPPAPKRVRLSTEAENLMRERFKAFQEEFGGRKALLDAEQADLEEKANKEILNETARQQALGLIRSTYSNKRLQLAQQEADAEREIQMASVVGERHLLENDPFKSEQEKREGLLKLMAQENALLKENATIINGRMNDPFNPLTPEARLAAEKQLQDLSQRQKENQLDITKTAAGGTLGGEMAKQLKDLKDQFGTVATQIAKTWKDVIGTAVSSIASGISGLIEGTETWSQALRQIGTSVLNVVIQGLVNMFAAMVLGEEDVAAAKLAKQAATIPGELVGALATAISEGGWAAVAIIAAAVAALGVGVAYAAGAFADGGRPPQGQIALVGERGPELWVPDTAGTIIPAHVTSSILSRQGNSTGGNRGNAGNGVQIQMHAWFDKTELTNHIRKNPDAQHAILEVVGNNSHLIMRNT